MFSGYTIVNMYLLGYENNKMSLYTVTDVDRTALHHPPLKISPYCLNRLSRIQKQKGY